MSNVEWNLDINPNARLPRGCKIPGMPGAIMA